MVRRILNRRELRIQAEEVAKPELGASEVVPGAAPPKKVARKPRAPKKPRPKKEKPRMRARWGVFDGGMRPIAIFDYNERGAADEKLANLLATKKGLHFLQIVKEPMPEPAQPEASAAE